MSDKLSDVQARLDSVQDLAAVVGAMRGIAAARAREARARLDGIRTCADTIAQAIGAALTLEQGDSAGTPDLARTNGGRIVIVLCAEQGFVGAFNEHLVAAAERQSGARATEYFFVGDRGALIAKARGMRIAWCAPMIAHASEMPGLGDRLTDALYRRLARGGVDQVTMLHATPQATEPIEIVIKTLLPFDFSRFAGGAQGQAPLTTLPLPRLLARLAEEYVYTQLCEAVLLSFAAENEARLFAMTSAQHNVRAKLAELTGQYRRLRQEEITAEIIELSAQGVAEPNKHER
ncbi:MAG: F0F1 ATP synthase subunit gamma [Burkholderiales bacterium]|nr:F0F1 ATP synthase subunit gamma [Burkholderiales bacterium]MDE2608208.1 F0F1 ATP synthase subunit gamma [Burkholderiales bacterium]